MTDFQDKRDLNKTTIIANEEIAEGIFLVSFKRTFDFLAGQVLSLTTDLLIPPRLYSIASGENEEYVRILFNIVPAGELTTKLSLLKPGHSIFVGKPFGKFQGTPDEAYWIAAGTGIAPFASMFFSGQKRKKTLIHGGRTLQSFYFEKEFAAGLGNNYIKCCSKESGADVYEGRLTSFLKEKNDFPITHKYYLCGSSEMVVETRDILLNKNIPFENIIAEIYF